MEKVITADEGYIFTWVNATAKGVFAIFVEMGRTNKNKNCYIMLHLLKASWYGLW